MSDQRNGRSNVDNLESERVGDGVGAVAARPGNIGLDGNWHGVGGGESGVQVSTWMAGRRIRALWDFFGCGVRYCYLMH